MFGRNKHKMRQTLHGELRDTLTACKEDWLESRARVEGSIDPSPEVLYYLKKKEAKYMFLLKTTREVMKKYS